MAGEKCTDRRLTNFSLNTGLCRTSSPGFAHVDCLGCGSPILHPQAQRGFMYTSEGATFGPECAQFKSNTVMPIIDSRKAQLLSRAHAHVMSRWDLSNTNQGHRVCFAVTGRLCGIETRTVRFISSLRINAYILPPEKPARQDAGHE
jgi:hypothetical protein